MSEEVPLTRMDSIPMTRLDNIEITILDDIQSIMDPNALVNRVFMMDSIEQNIPIPTLISASYRR